METYIYTVISMGLGLLIGYFSAGYLELKKFVTLLNEILKDNQVTTQELQKLFNIIRKR